MEITMSVNNVQPTKNADFSLDVGADGDVNLVCNGERIAFFSVVGEKIKAYAYNLHSATVNPLFHINGGTIFKTVDLPD